MKTQMRLVFTLCAVALAGCAGGPPAPDWQMNAHGAVERATVAELEGNQRVAEAEWRRARQETARTARPDLVARVELSRCALRQAGLVMEPCAGFDALAQDAAPAEQAYARYLQAQPQAADVALLPVAHRPVANALLQTGVAGGNVLRAVGDPVARLVAASVWLRAGRADPDMVRLAVDTASAQGWRRSLLAWLEVQARVAEQAGDQAQADQARRRAALLAP
ncbi:hypothetical protein [Hydrogenophaga aquatica]